MDAHKQKTLLIIGAGVEACAGIAIAKAMKLRLVVADGNKHAPGFDCADQSICASTYDPEAIIAACESYIQKGGAINGVIAMCADVPLSAAKIAQHFGLPGLPIRCAKNVADKLLMKEQLAKRDIPIPSFMAIGVDTYPRDIVKHCGLPLVIKPVDSRGARGVQLIEFEDQLPEAIKTARQESPSGRVMAEAYLAGPQISTETLIENGKAYTIGFADRNYEWLENTKPFFIENGGDAPTCLAAPQKQGIIDTVEQAALALGIENGVAKGDMVYTKDGAKVIEIAGRLSGGYFSTTQIPLATGVNFIEQAIKIALGERLNPDDLQPKYNRGVAIRYLKLQPGKIASIHGTESVKSVEGHELSQFFIREGDTVPALSNHTQRAGFVICSGDTKDQAIKRAQRALAEIRVSYA